MYVYMYVCLYVCVCSKIHSKKLQISNGWWIFQMTVCCPLVQKRLTDILVNRLISVCAQTVDWYIGTKRKTMFNEKQEINTLVECKRLSQEKSSTLTSKQLTDVLVHERSRRQIYNCLLSKHRSDCMPF